jgi:hypothetical protein
MNYDVKKKTYPLLDQEKFAAHIERLQGPAIDPYKSMGRVTVCGALIEWRIVNTEITLEVLEKPVHASYGEIWNNLSPYFNYPGVL